MEFKVYQASFVLNEFHRQATDVIDPPPPTIWKTVSGNPIQVIDAVASPMQKCEVTLEPIQSGSGDPSPTNIRPIQGRTGTAVNVSGADISNPTTYSVTFPDSVGTVYGGTYDFVSGVLTDKYDWMIAQSNGNMKKADGTVLTVSGYRSGGYVFYDVDTSGNAKDDTIVCNMYKNGHARAVNNSCYVYNSSSDSRVSFTDTSIPGWTTAQNNIELADAFTTFVANQYAQGNVLFVLWEKQNPVTHELTPQQVSTNAGENNVWGDGTIELTYLGLE